MVALKYWSGSAWTTVPTGGGITLPLTQPLTFSPDNTHDIGASGASRPRDTWIGRNLDVVGTSTLRNLVTISDRGYDTPSILNQGYSRFNGRVGFGPGAGGHDPIALVFIGVNNPSTSLMTGSNQYMLMCEYWANSLATGTVKGLEVGVIGSASGTGEVRIAEFKSVGKNVGNINYAKQVVIGSQTPGNGSIENIGLDVGDQSGGSGENWSIWSRGPVRIDKNLRFAGSAQRIHGNWSDSTAANRPIFQNYGGNGDTHVGIMPSGSNSLASLQLYAGSDPANTSILQLYSYSTAAVIEATKTGTGVYRDMLFNTSGVQRMVITATGELICKATGNYDALRLGGGSGGYSGLWGYAAALLGGNAWYDGAWHRHNTALGATHVNVGYGAVQFQTAPAGGADPPTWTERLAVYPDGRVVIPQNNQLQWADANSEIQSNGRTMYFDEYNNGWQWRNSAAGYAIAASLSAGGALTLSGRTLYFGTLGVLLHDGTRLLHQSDSHQFVNLANSAYNAINAGSFVVTSTLKAKRDLRNLDQPTALTQVLDRRATPLSYAQKNTDGTVRYLGFTAEDLVQVVPEAVSRDLDGQPAGIDYGSLVPVLWNAVRELSARLQALEGAA